MDRYEKDLHDFRELLAKDSEEALKRFGLSLIHSINPAERVLALRSFGIDCNSAVDFYNLGVHAIQQDNWTEAIVNFQQAIEADPTQTDSIYNLALCYERTGHTPQARQTWEIYMDVTSDEREKEQIREHLKSLE
ncbi:MAG: tetratricopeptide repeat protein [Candidatus Sumerlaeia bacterium]|nr:tetratricopeptide repeat protein [Candidatus Sumerlaeia bacterium]